MDEDHKHGGLTDALPGETSIPLLHGPLSATEQLSLKQKLEEKTEKQAEAAYKERQLALANSANSLTATNVTFTWILALLTAVSAGAALYQGHVASRAARAAEIATRAAIDSVYMACLTAQATQETLIQVQKSFSDSHASAAATVEQARVGITAERAIIEFIPRFPSKEEIVTNPIGIPFILRNEGKSEATALTFRATAVLLQSTEKLIFRKKLPMALTAYRVPAGYEYPERPQDPKQSHITASLNLSNVAGQELSAFSPDVQSFLSIGPRTAYTYGRIVYKDFFGVHSVNFCVVVFTISAGTSRVTSENDFLCSKYNKQQDEYITMPRISESVLTQRDLVQSIVCERPLNARE